MSGKVKRFCQNLKILVGLLASIAFVIGGLTWFLPWLIGKIHNWVFIGAVVLILIPVFPVVSGFLQGEKKSFKGFLNEYFNTAVEFFFEILYLVILMPLVGLRILAVLGVLLLIAAIIGTGMWLIQEHSNLWLGVSIEDREVFKILIFSGFVAVYEIVFWGGFTIFSRKKIDDKLIEFYLGIEKKCHYFINDVLKEI